MTGSSRRRQWVTWGLMGIVGVVVLLTALLASVPPVSKDALVHHLAVPKIYLRHGGMVELPSMPYAYYPMNLELLYWASLALGSDILPKYIHFAFALATAGVLFGYLRKRLSTAYGLLGSLFFLSVPIIVKLSITVYIDLGVICFTTCSVLLLFRWLEQGFRFRHLSASAVFCGLALGTKYNALIALFLLTLFVPFLYVRRAPPARGRSVRALLAGAAFFLIAVLTFSPWLVRNHQWTGNPLHPLYEQWFQDSRKGAAGDATSTLAKVVVPQKVGHGMFTYRREVYGESGWEIALLPLRIFFQGQDGNPRYFDGKLHPFLFILPFFAFLRSRERPLNVRTEMGTLLAFAVLFFAFALFSRTLRIRYVAPMIPPLVILSVFGVRNLVEWIRARERGRARSLGFLLLGVGLLAAGAYSAEYLLEQYHRVRPLGYVTGEMGREAYITSHRAEYPVAQCANRELPRNANVLLTFMGRRGYYLDRDYIPGVARLGRLVQRSGSAEDVARTLRKDRISHLMVFLPILERWSDDNLSEPKRNVMKAFFQNHTKAICFHEGYALFSLKEGSG